MIIYFEGLACVGKTTLVNYLEKHITSAITISELPKNYLELGKITDALCRRNDERKCTEAKESNKKYDFTLVDRGYASTLVYNFIEYASKVSNEYLTTLSWYMSGILTHRLVKPDLYIYITLDAKTAIKRAKQLNRLSTKYAWFNYPQIGLTAYDFFFKFLEPEVPRLVIDGNLTLKQQVSLINQELVKHNYTKRT
ncbi:MAG: hypothetical protein WC784_01920 [Candidatus Shapirobacteria bacterium]|jgi:thymidylate kinase